MQADLQTFKVTRKAILDTVRAATEPSQHFLAMWEGGAAAFNRIDEWSDIDLYLGVQDDHLSKGIETIESALSKLSAIALKHEIPQPSWHGHWQAFYKLEHASPFHVLDLVIMKNSSSNRFLQPEIHGEVKVYFDKTGFTETQPVDHKEFEKKLEKRLETLRVTFPLFQSLVLKELNRGNNIEALAFYQAFTLRPLVELLRIRQSPMHYDFNTRYLYYDLPARVVERLERLFFVSTPNDLDLKREQAEEWFASLLSEPPLNMGGLISKQSRAKISRVNE